ncbi:RyR domain-containing protein [Mycolicibacterium sp.]|uniref:RyR domain-containing protein n=2 Tax=Mycolicibacterium sp. TaxID=2320850 RepID=UPI003D0B9E3D
MRGRATAERAARVLSVAVALALVAYLAVVALRGGPPSWLGDFGRPGSEWTIAVVLAALTTACVLTYRNRGARRSGVPIAIIAVLAATVLVLGLASFWNCYDEHKPRFFYPLIWTIALFTGDTSEPDLVNCFTVAPVALDVARLAAFATLFLGAVLVAGALLQSRLDRLRVALSRKPVTVVVDIDDDAQSMVCAILASSKSAGPLVLLTDQPDRPCVHEARVHGARVNTVDFNHPPTLTALSFWRRLERLYLLSPDAWANEVRLEMIGAHTPVPKDQRLQLVVRIDDPWQAEAWRARLFGRTDAQWAADAVGLYEVTAHRLLEDIVNRPDIEWVIVCGTSRLTLALCSELAQRQVERDYYTAPGQRPLPRLTTVAPDAEEYHRDHEYRFEQLGLPSSHGQFDAVAATPSVSLLTDVIRDGTTDPSRVAVIFVDPDPIAGAVFDSTTATRLATRFRTTPIFAWEAEARLAGQRQTTIGQLRTFRLALHLADDQAPDRWERAAMLIHSRYAAGAPVGSAAAAPWGELDPFYKDSNRLLVKHMLRIVEEIAEHTWNSWNGPAPEPVVIPHDADPLDQLELMGFDREAAVAMAKAEHERWVAYYVKHHWRYAPQRDNDRKLHPSLQDWSAIQADEELYRRALTAVAVTLLSLRELGYRSRSVWESFERTGTVIARQRSEPWTWTTGSGAKMTAEPGDWEVRDADGGSSWSVRDGIFQSTYVPADTAANWYRRVGTVQARRARPGERIETLEGPASAANGDWIVKGEQGEMWPVPADQFARRYRRVETRSQTTTQAATG